MVIPCSSRMQWRGPAIGEMRTRSSPDRTMHSTRVVFTRFFSPENNWHTHTFTHDGEIVVIIIDIVLIFLRVRSWDVNFQRSSGSIFLDVSVLPRSTTLNWNCVFLLTIGRKRNYHFQKKKKYHTPIWCRCLKNWNILKNRRFQNLR